LEGIAAGEAGAFTKVELAGDVTDSLLPRTICSWRCLEILSDDPRLSESWDRALDRLRVANPGAVRPLFRLGLDGVDEAAEKRREIKGILRWFWQLPTQGGLYDAAVVVTCRDASQVEELLGVNVSGRPAATRSLPTVTVGEFEWYEVLDLVRLKFPPDIHSRLEDAVRDFDFQTRSPPRVANEAMPSRDILKALRHPIMCGLFLDLADDTIRTILDGIDAGAQKLAQDFVKWFSVKVEKRCSVVSSDDVTAVVRAVATATGSASAAANSISEWIRPAATIVGQNMASRLH
jgi:hypothetical protein